MPDSSPSHSSVILDIIKNFPQEIVNFKRIPCAMQSIYTGIIGGAFTSAIALVSTGKLRSLKVGILGYAVSSIASWHWCRNKLKEGETEMMKRNSNTQNPNKNS